jgi:hypothetical protein
MKTSQQNSLCISLLMGVAVLGAITWSQAAPAPAPTDSFTNSFDTSTQPSWIYWYSINPGNSAITWDDTMDAGSNASSGSLRLEIPFSTTNNQQVWFGTFHNAGIYDSATTYDATYFTNIEFDILVDPISPTTAAGDFGNMYVSLVRRGTPDGGGPFNVNNILTIPSSASNRWVHLTVPVLKNQLGYDDPGVIGPVFRMDSFDNHPHAPVRFWLDNVSIKFSGAAPPPPPPPAMTVERPVRGLNLFTSGSGDYQRESIRTANTGFGANYSWVGATGPVTYSFTVAGYPGAGHAGFHTFIYLVPFPLTGSGDNNTAPDYQESNVIYLSLDLGATGNANYTFRWKTNMLASNGTGGGTNDFYSAPHESIGYPTALGTWSVTFVNNTNVTMTAPGGGSTNFSISPNLAALFPNPIYVYFGVRPDTADADKGPGLVLSRARILGTTDTIDDNFLADPPGPPDASIWELEAVAPQGVFIMPPENNFTVNWTAATAAGFNLQTNSVLGNTNSFPWSTNGLPAPLDIGTLKRTFLSSNDVPSVGTRYFRLAKPGF